MNIVVPIKQIPNLTDELEINSEGTHLDHDALQYVLNEFDEHALEEAVLTKESAGGTVTVIGVDTTGELNEALHTALAKGADKAVKITGDFPRGTASHTQAKLLADAIKGLSPDLVFTGVQAAHQPPRYAPVSKIRQIAKATKIEEIAGGEAVGAGSSVRRMFKPESAGHAEMWEGSPEEVAEKIVALIKEKGLLKG